MRTRDRFLEADLIPERTPEENPLRPSFYRCLGCRCRLEQNYAHAGNRECVACLMARGEISRGVALVLAGKRAYADPVREQRACCICGSLYTAKRANRVTCGAPDCRAERRRQTH